MRTKADKNLISFDFPKLKKEKPPQEDELIKHYHGKPRYKFIKEPDEIDYFNSPGYLFTKIYDFKAKNRNDRLVSASESLQRRRRAGQFVTLADSTEQALEEEKTKVRGKISQLYSRLNRFQKGLSKDKEYLNRKHEEHVEEMEEVLGWRDMNLSVNQLIKDSIVETYDMVKKNKKANTLKMFVCSAKNYLKKTKKI